MIYNGQGAFSMWYQAYFQVLLERDTEFRIDLIPRTYIYVSWSWVATILRRIEESVGQYCYPRVQFDEVSHFGNHIFCFQPRGTVFGWLWMYYCSINNVTIINKYPLPCIHRGLCDHLNRDEVFLKIYLWSTYKQICAGIWYWKDHFVH
jgi:hypothetical protein